MNPRVSGVGLTLCVSVFLSAPALAAQGTRSSPSTGRIVVSVKDADGSPFPYLVGVQLFTRGTGLVSSSSTQRGDQAVFENVSPGNYTVEINAAGYKKAVQPATLNIAGETVFVYVVMQPDNLGAGPPPGPPILAPKALAETQKGLRALQQNNLTEAKTHLERALELAPNSPDVNYLTGVLYLQLGDAGKAIAHLEKTRSLDPKHGLAVLSLGEAYYRQKAYAEAAEALEQGLVLRPSFWRAHLLASSVFFQLENFQKAQEHAEAALRMGKQEAREAHYLLAKCLAARGQREQAITQLETFLSNPPQGSVSIGPARQLLQQLRAPAPAVPPPVSLPDAMAASSIVVPMLLLRWAPPDIDEAVPETTRGTACELPGLLEQAGVRVKELVSNIEKFAATEKLEHERLDAIGIPFDRESRQYEYVATIEETRPGNLIVDEHRGSSYGRDLFPAQISTRGLAVLALVFHPYHREEFEYACEGLADWQRTPSWVVHFRQRADRERRMRDYRVNQHSYAVSLKGRAWIDANNSQILRIESDLVEPVPAIRLARDHLAVDYAPVCFEKQNTQLWLPQFAEWYVDLGGKKYHRRHSFTNFLLFSVEEKQRITPPKEVALGTPEGRGKN